MATPSIEPKLIATISGKGGVGKTTLALGTAFALKKMGYRVGIVDIDIESSSLGDALGLNYQKLNLGEKIQPAEVDGVKIISLSMFLDEEWEDIPTLVSEERVFHLVEQMFASVDWGELDYLVADTPPGTGPELRALARRKVCGLILVAATQRLSEMPVRRLVKMAREEYRLPIIGMVSNNPYNTDGDTNSGEAIAARYKLPFITTIPWTPEVRVAMDERKPVPVELFEPVAQAVVRHSFPQVTLKVVEAANLRKQINPLTGRRLTRKGVANEMGVSIGRVGQLLKEAKREGLI